jgi:hypothetical protein
MGPLRVPSCFHHSHGRQEMARLIRPPSVTGKGVCDEESSTAYTQETFTVLRVGQEILLINASILVRLVNEYSDPKVDEAYTNKPAVVTMYRRIRSNGWSK